MSSDYNVQNLFIMILIFIEIYYKIYKTFSETILGILYINARYLRQIFVFLLFCAISVNLINAKIRVCAVTKRNSRRCSRYFLYDYYMIHICAICAAILLLHRDAQQTQFAQLFPECLNLEHLYQISNCKILHEI